MFSLTPMPEMLMVAKVTAFSQALSSSQHTADTKWLHDWCTSALPVQRSNYQRLTSTALRGISSNETAENSQVPLIANRGENCYWCFLTHNLAPTIFCLHSAIWVSTDCYPGDFCNIWQGASGRGVRLFPWKQICATTAFFQKVAFLLILASHIR